MLKITIGVQYILWPNHIPRMSVTAQLTGMMPWPIYLCSVYRKMRYLWLIRSIGWILIFCSFAYLTGSESSNFRIFSFTFFYLSYFSWKILRVTWLSDRTARGQVCCSACVKSWVCLRFEPAVTAMAYPFSTLLPLIIVFEFLPTVKQNCGFSAFFSRLFFYPY